MMSCRSCCPWRPLWFCPSVYWQPYRTTRNMFVLLLLKLLKHFTTCKLQGGYTLSRCGDLFSWWLSGEVKHFVHLIRLNLNSRLCPCGLTWPRSLWGNNARLCKLAVNLNPFHCRHQLVPHSVPNSSPVPLGNVLWGSGVCSVFVRSVSPCRFVLEVRSFPPPPALFRPWPVVCVRFSLPLAFQGLPGPGRVCVCV